MGKLGQPVRVGLVHPLRTWLQALTVVLEAIPDIDVVISHPEPRWVRHAVAQGDVDVVVMLVTTDDGLEHVAGMRQARADVGIVIIGDADVPGFIAGVVRAGARGYLAQDCSVLDLHRAIRCVADGDAWMSPSHLMLLVDGLLSSPPPEHDEDDRLAVLTEREREILECLADGMRRQDIANRLYISPNTVRTHINRLIKKLHVHSALAAVSITTGSAEASTADAEEMPRVPAPRRSAETEQVNRPSAL